jgi:23S rRNA (guanosine2251-2'-O)-methyltransferase
MESKVYGLHAVASLVESDPRRVRRMVVLEGRVDRRLGSILAAARAAGIRFEQASRRELDRLAEGGRHQGVVALCEAVALASEAELELRWPTLTPPHLLLVLDGIMDPRNLGACLRSADAAGVQVVLLPKRRSAPVSEVARKTASGAAESLFIVEVTNLARRLEWLKSQGVWIVGAAGDAATRFDVIDFQKPVALIVGGEEKGLRQLTRSLCDETAAIPMAGSVASLNVSVATGILLFEVVRQRASGRLQGAGTGP